MSAVADLCPCADDVLGDHDHPADEPCQILSGSDFPPLWSVCRERKWLALGDEWPEVYGEGDEQPEQPAKVCCSCSDRHPVPVGYRLGSQSECLQLLAERGAR